MKKFLAIMISSLLTVGTLTSAVSASETTGVEPDGIVPGTSLTVVWDSDKQTHLPYTSDSHGTLYMEIYDTLFCTQDGETTGLIAESWEMSEDGMEYVIQIHDNIDYCLKDGSVGDHVTADKVVRSLQLTEKYMSNYFTNIESYEATGEYEITVKFSAPYADFLSQFSSMFTGIVDPDLVAEYGEESNQAAVGTGPYYLAEYQEGEYFLFKANTHYWNDAHFAHIETVRADIIPESATAQQALMAGNIDWMETDDIAIVTALCADGEHIYYETQGAFNPLYFNTNRCEVLRDERVREAISLLIDPVELVNNAYGGYGSVYEGPWASNIHSYQAFAGYNDVDVEKAMALFDEAGVDPSTLVLKTYYSYLDMNYMPNLQAMLAKYGITLDVDGPYDVGTFVQSVGKGDWDVMAWFGIADANAPYSAYSGMFSTNGFFRTLFINETYPQLQEEVEALLAEASVQTTIDAQCEVLKQIDQIIVDNHLVAKNVAGAGFIVYDSDLRNMIVEDHYSFTELYELYWAE